jgi:hypothetical protein
MVPEWQPLPGPPLPPFKITERKAKVRIEFADEAIARMDALQKITHASTRDDVVKNALSLYEWFVTNAKQDSIIKIVNKNNKLVSDFEAKLLLE